MLYACGSTTDTEYDRIPSHGRGWLEKQSKGAIVAGAALAEFGEEYHVRTHPRDGGNEAGVAVEFAHMADDAG